MRARTMGDLFEFYVDPGTDEAAVESAVREMESEIGLHMQRTLGLLGRAEKVLAQYKKEKMPGWSTGIWKRIVAALKDVADLEEKAAMRLHTTALPREV